MKKMIFIVICLALSGCVQKGVLFGELVDDEWVWFKNGDENTYSKYEGEIRKDVPNGQGTIISPDGTKYVGEFKDGEGTDLTIYYKNGNIIRRHERGWYWVKGVLFGELVDDEWIWFKNGDENTLSKYEGGIRKGVPNGQGTLISPDGRKYVGEFRNGKFHGQGTRTFPDGRKYVGKFKDGEYHGQGTDTFPDGRKYIGEFREGRPWNITHYDKNGNIIVKFVNGVEKAPEASEEPAVEVKCRRVESLAEGASVIGSAVSDVKITNALNMLLDDGRKGNNPVKGHTIPCK